MRIRRTLSVFIALLTAASLVTACDSGGGGDSGDKRITANGLEPQNPLLPANTGENGGGRVIEAVFSRLIRFEPHDGAAVNEVAESIQTTDSKVWTFTIKPNWKFHDGTPVTANSFVKAWNWNAYGPNGQLNASFFDKIDGFGQVHPVDPDGEEGPQKAPEPSTQELKGLEVIDDRTFRVTLAEPFSLFSTVVGHIAFSPLPESFYADPKAFGEKPIGNGPFKLDHWNHNSEIKLSRFEDYPGTKPKIDGVTFKIYTSLESAYTDLQANNLDYLDTIPSNVLAGGQFKKDLGEDRYEETPVLINSTVTFPLYDPKYQNPDFRRALSMAINRDEIADKIYHGSRKPIASYGPSRLEGYQPTGCEYCVFDPAKARELLAKSGVPSDTTVGISYNADGPSKDGVDAACGSITNVLGLKCAPDSFASFAALRTKASANEMTTMFDSGWQADYPALENFLTPLFRTGAAANDAGYSNPAVDAKFAEADRATDKATALRLYQEAQRLILNDMPSIPLFEVVAQTGSSTRMRVANTNIFGALDLFSAEVK